MSVTVRDVLSLEVMKPAQLLAGKDGLDRNVRWVHVSDVPEPTRWLVGEEFILTNAVCISHEEALQEKFIYELESINAAGVAISCGGPFLKHVTEGMKKIANSFSLPLIELPWELRFVNITLAICNLIISRQYERLRKAQESHNQLMQVMLEGQGLSSIARVLSQLVGNPVAIENINFRILAYAGSTDRLDPVWRESILLKRKPERFLDHPTIRKEIHQLTAGKKPSRLGPVTELETMSRVVVPVMAGTEHLGYVFVLEVERELQEQDLVTLEQAATIIALEMSKNIAILEARRRVEGNFLDDLFFGQIESEEMISRRAAYLGLDPDLPSMVAVVDIDQLEEYIRNQRANESSIQKIRLDIRDLIAAVVADRGVRAFMTEASDSLIVVFQPVDSGFDWEILEELLNRVGKKHEGLSLSIGVSPVTKGFRNLTLSFTKAKQSLLLGKKIFPQKKIHLYENLSFYQLFLSPKPEDEVKTYYRETVARLVEYDLRHRTSLAHTLEVFLGSYGNKKEAAVKLFVHRNTLSRQIKKIEELLGVDLDDGEVRFRLQLGLKVRHLVL